jgi:acyl-CoA dehydrogenase
VPTGEVELRGAEAYLVGEPERGFKYMAEMLNMERLHNAMGSVGLMSRALLESRVQVEHREAFGGPLVEKPLMRRDLLEMAVDHEGATAFAFDAARAFDRYHRQDDDEAYRLMRILVPAAKHRTGRMAVETASYALEIQGGNGYVRDWVTHRLLRDAQVLPVWEGTSNVLSLDVLRAMLTEGAHVAALDRIDEYLGGLDGRLNGTADIVRRHREDLSDAVDALATADRDVAEREAKAFTDLLFDVYAGALLLAEADRDLADGDGRKALVARAFVDRHLRTPERRGIATGENLPLDHFEAIHYFEQVDPAVLDRPAAAD